MSKSSSKPKTDDSKETSSGSDVWESCPPPNSVPDSGLHVDGKGISSETPKSGTAMVDGSSEDMVTGGQSAVMAFATVEPGEPGISEEARTDVKKREVWCWGGLIVCWISILLWVTAVTTVSFLPSFGDANEWHNASSKVTHFVRLLNCEVDAAAESFGNCPKLFTKINLYWIVGLCLGLFGVSIGTVYLGYIVLHWSKDSGSASSSQSGAESPKTHNTANRSGRRRMKKCCLTLCPFIIPVVPLLVCFATPLVGGYCLVRSLHLKYASILSEETPRIQWKEYRALHQWIASFALLSGFFIPSLSAILYIKKRGNWSTPNLVPVIFDFVKITKVRQPNGTNSELWTISEVFSIRERNKRWLALLIFWGLACVLIGAYIGLFANVGLLRIERVSGKECFMRINSSWDCFRTNTKYKHGIFNCSGLENNWTLCVHLADLSFNPQTGILVASGISTGLVLFLRSLISLVLQILGKLSETDDRKSKHYCPGLFTVIVGLVVLVFWVAAEVADCSNIYQVSFLFKVELLHLGFSIATVGILVLISDVNVTDETPGSSSCSTPHRKELVIFYAVVIGGWVLLIVNWMLFIELDCH